MGIVMGKGLPSLSAPKKGRPIPPPHETSTKQNPIESYCGRVDNDGGLLGRLDEKRIYVRSRQRADAQNRRTHLVVEWKSRTGCALRYRGLPQPPDRCTRRIT